MPLLVPEQKNKNGIVIMFLQTYQTKKKAKKDGRRIPLVLLDKMEIIPSNNNSPVHLSTVTCSSQDTATDGNIASEGALLVNIGSCIQKE